MLRRLLNIASIVCLVTCVALMGMWVRSYRTQDDFHGLLWGNRALIIDSFRDRLRFHEYAIAQDALNRFWPWSIGGRTILVHDDYDSFQFRQRTGFPGALGFHTNFTFTSTSVVIPFWFVILSAGAVAGILRLNHRFQFTLRGLFIATTFLAFVMSMSAWLDR
jgi:hypothetical protein